MSFINLIINTTFSSFLIVVLFGLPLFSETGKPMHAKNSWQKLSKKYDQLAEKEEVELDNSLLQSYNNTPGLWVRISAGRSFEAIAQKYAADIEEFKDLNNLTSSRISKEGWYFVPCGSTYFSQLGDRSNIRQKITVPKGEFIWPIQGSHITSRIGNRWGRMHPGLDIAAGIGTVVVAASDGVVIARGRDGAYGISVMLSHETGVTSRYAHLSAVFVRDGDKVKKGQILGLSGNTGRTTGPHLHFEVRSTNIVLDPEQFMPAFESMQDSAMQFRDRNMVRVNNPNDLL